MVICLLLLYTTCFLPECLLSFCVACFFHALFLDVRCALFLGFALFYKGDALLVLARRSALLTVNVVGGQRVGGPRCRSALLEVNAATLPVVSFAGGQRCRWSALLEVRVLEVRAAVVSDAGG